MFRSTVTAIVLAVASLACAGGGPADGFDSEPEINLADGKSDWALRIYRWRLSHKEGSKAIVLEMFPGLTPDDPNTFRAVVGRPECDDCGVIHIESTWSLTKHYMRLKNFGRRLLTDDDDDEDFRYEVRNFVHRVYRGVSAVGEEIWEEITEPRLFIISLETGEELELEPIPDGEDQDQDSDSDSDQDQDQQQQQQQQQP